MSHFAKVENGVVTEVIVAEQDFINTGILGDPSIWIQTSYNTHGNVHYGPDGKPDGGTPLRGNFAGIGSIYDKENDVFYDPQPIFKSWTLNKNKWKWEAPVAFPTDIPCRWDEDSLSWIDLSIKDPEVLARVESEGLAQLEKIKSNQS